MKLVVILLSVMTGGLAGLLAVNIVNPLSDDMINDVNRLDSSWKAGRNFDPTELDHVVKMLGVKTDGKTPRLPALVHEDISDLPESFDARKKWPKCPTISKISDQGSCGSCWAFGAVEAMSDRHCIASGGKTIVQISAEDLISCCPSCGDGCQGGYSSAAWSYWVDSGLVSGGHYKSTKGCLSYTVPACRHQRNGSLSLCGVPLATPSCSMKCDASFSGSYVSDKYYGVKAYSITSNVEQIQHEILTNGPVEAEIRIYADFPSYKSGVYIPTSDVNLGGHAVRILGWGVENGTAYWLVANSWNESWGDKGFFKIRRGTNECGIEGNINAGTPRLK